MNSNRSENRMIPSILSLPEKFSGFLGKLLRLRLPIKRRFSMRDVLLALGALLLLLLSALIPALRGLRLPVCLFAALLSCVPLVLQGMRLVRRRKIPAEEICIFLSTVLAFLLKEYTAAVLIPALGVLLFQTEGYSLLHCEAAPDALNEAQEPLRRQVEDADPEHSKMRRLLAFGVFAAFCVLCFAAAITLILTLFHLYEPQKWLHAALIILALSPMTAIWFASMLTHFGALFSAAKSGILFRNGTVPERFRECRLFAFGKTGTVTDGRFVISDICPTGGIGEDDLLRIAAIAECKSGHPIARALKAAAGLEEGVIPAGFQNCEEIPGKGVSTLFSDHQIYVGNAALLDEHEIWYQVPAKSGSAIHIAVDGTYRGHIMIADALRVNAFEALEELRAQGVRNLVMLTGDVRSASRKLASSLNFDMVKPELSPEEKGSAVRYLRSVHGEKARIACAGDGFHDAWMFEAADVSVSMNADGGESADVRILSEDILGIPSAYRFCRESGRILEIGAITVLLVKLMLCILGCAAVLPLPMILAVDFLVEAGAVIYALTSLTMEKRKTHIRP
ncbi:MAG: HAD-IC family P-type ATPase [Oscillospiraceae bacterium]|nr:HAD-IC family P-type ATPase [Oscillospiraceae bacterium]